uniref:Uncharacterized protein n=1 Tax=Oryza punctata TaxID=4537 RepID=A0A0E0ML65_ORYPU
MEENPLSVTPPVPSEKRAPTTLAPWRTPKAAKPSTYVKGAAPTRKSPPNHNNWCSIHKKSRHSLVECKVIFHVKAELDPAKIELSRAHHHTKSGARYTNRKVNPLPAEMKKSLPYQLQGLLDPSSLLSDPPMPRSISGGSCGLGSQDFIIAYVDVDPREPSVLHSLDDQESSGSNFLRELNVIDGAVEDVREDGEVRSDDLADPHGLEHSTRTAAEHLNVIGSLPR